MDASLDTNVIMHLYGVDLQGILFSRFEKLKVYAFIRSGELARNASPKIIQAFDKDVEAERIEIITDEYLKLIGMYPVFKGHVDEMRILYNPGDLGEVYAIAMAKTLGCMCLVTDDIKEYGPHYTLMRIEDSEVMPFTFYELLFLDYLEQGLTDEELYDRFKKICDSAGEHWRKTRCLSKLSAFKRRFFLSPYTESEREWMQSFCEDNGINAWPRLDQLKVYLGKNEET